MWIYGLYLLIGAIGGTVIGALGTGSSLIILPMLSLIFPTLFPDAPALKMAVATCMACLMVGSVSGSISYARSKMYDLRVMKIALPGLIGGSLLAPKISHLLPSDVLRLYISAIVVLIAVVKLIQQYRGRRNEEDTRPLQPMRIFVAALLSSTLSGMAGVALGIFMIPFLLRYTHYHQALGTNLILAVPYSILGTISYMASGWQLHLDTPDYSFGYVYLPAFAIISISIAIFPFVGLHLVKNISVKALQRVFYFYLLIVGAVIAA